MRSVKGGVVHSKIKTKILLVAFMLLPLECPRLVWSTAYQPTAGQTAARVLQDVTAQVQRAFGSARTSPYGVFVEINIAKIGGVYTVIALLLLLNPKYRNEGWNNFGLCCIVPLILIVWFVAGYAIATEFRDINQAQGSLSDQYRQGIGSWLIAMITGIIWPLLMIALGLTLWIGVPLYALFFLFVVPSILYVILRLLVRLPVITYHYLHYLTVPHPAETAYRAGVAEHLPIPELARSVADAMYRYDLKDFDGLPPQWKSKNYKKRIEAFDNLLKAQAGFLRERSAAWQKEEERFMEEFIKNLRLKSQLRE
jgi:hypothetical protein